MNRNWIIGVALGAGLAWSIHVTAAEKAETAPATQSQPASQPASAPAVGAAVDTPPDDPDAEARTMSTRSTLQTLRGQIELFKIQHMDIPPDENALIIVLTGKTGDQDTDRANPGGRLGPYVVFMPLNPQNGKSAVGTKPSPDVGWVYKVNGQKYTLEAVNRDGNGVLPY
jgi:hypothetical protein